MATDEPVVFSQTFEALLVKALGPKITPRLKAKLAAEGVDVDRLKPIYPKALWHKTVHIVASELFPAMAAAQAFRGLGRETFTGFRQTNLGGAVTSMIKLMGPKKSLARMAQNFQATSNYIKTEIADLSPTSVKLWISDGASVDYMAGIVEARMELAGAKNLRVNIVDRDKPGYTFQVEWSE